LIAEELAMMTAERPSSAAAQYPASAPEERASFEVALQRIENSERYLSEALTSVNERLRAINAQIAKQADAFGHSEEGENHKALETALRNVVGHIEVSERRTNEVLKRVQDQVSEIGQRTDATADKFTRIDQFETLLARIAEKIERQAGDQVAKRCATLEMQVSQLTERLQFLQGSGDMLVERSKSAVMGAVRGELSEIEKNLQTIISQAQSSIKQSSASTGDIARLQTDVARAKADIGGLNQRIDDIKGESASERDMRALQRTIEQLSNRLAEMPVAETERRLSDIAQRLAQAELRERDLPQINQVVRRIRELEDRIAADSPQLQNLEELQQRISRIDGRLAGTEEELKAEFGSLNQRIDAMTAETASQRELQALQETIQRLSSGTEEQLSAIAGIERSISQLFRALEDHREDVPEIAEQAARRIVEQFAEISPAAVVGPEPAPEIKMLKEALAELREQAARSDQQTQETLDAIHEAFEGIVNKLSELEAGQRAVLEAGLADGRRGEAETSASQEIPSAASPEWQDAPHDELTQTSRAAHASDVSDQEGDIFVTNDESLSGARTTEPVEDDDFIAAARRAAQAAALGARMSGRYAAGAEMPRQGQKTSGAKPFSLSLFQRAPALKPRRPPGLPEDIAAAADMATLPQDNKRKRLLLAALLLLVAVSAYALRSGQKEAPPPAPAPQGLIEQSSSTDLTSLQTQQWYRAAFDGVAPAQYRLGMMYEHGTGVERNIGEAKLWYEKAAVQGNLKAMHNLGSLLAALEPPDYSGAAEWFLLAARYGVKDSQYNIALLYDRGLGVQQDAVEAFFWYSAAARQGDIDALARSRTVEELLPLELKSEARRRLNEWRPLEAAPEANDA
jgi:localization factor PodJL